MKTDFIWNREGLLYQFFLYCETQTLTKNRDTRPSSFIHKTFRYAKFSETQTCSPTKNLDFVGHKIISTIKLFPPLMRKIFRNPTFSETHKGSPTILSFTVREKLWQKIVIHTPLLLSIETFDTRSFLKQKRVPLRKVWTLWDKKLIAEKSDIPFLCVNFFPYLTFSETEKGSPTEFFCTVRQKIWQKLVKQPLFFYPLKFSKPEIFLKHRMVLLRNVSVRWDKTVSTENRDTCPLSYP